MKHTTYTIEDVKTQLSIEGLYSSSDDAQVLQILQDEANVSPWYIRTLIGLGAWVASFFFLLFLGIAAFNLRSDGYLILFGSITVGAVVILYRLTRHDFFNHMALSFSIAGQTLFAIGLFELTNWREAEYVLPGLMLLQVFLFLVIRDGLHRFLSVAAIITELVVEIYILKVSVLLHAVVVVLALTYIEINRREPKIIESGTVSLWNPVKYAMLMSVMGVMLLSTVSVLPEMKHELFFPYPWISTLLLDVLLIYLVYHISEFGSMHVRTSVKSAIYIGCLLLGMASWQAPGLILSFIVLITGFHFANRIAMGLAITFSIVFLTTFFYGIEISLLHKSYTLIGTGLLLMFGWFLIRTQIREQGGAPHA